jgi:hypothetical protein
MYVWTVKGKTIEDISISTLQSPKKIIMNRINRRKKRREKWQESKS